MRLGIWLYWVHLQDKVSLSYITESQNGCCCKGTQLVILSSFLAQAGPPRVGCPGLLLSISKVGIHNLPGKPVSVLSHPHSEKLFPNVQTEPPVFRFGSIASCHWATQKRGIYLDTTWDPGIPHMEMVILLALKEIHTTLYQQLKDNQMALDAHVQVTELAVKQEKIQLWL